MEKGDIMHVTVPSAAALMPDIDLRFMRLVKWIFITWLLLKICKGHFVSGKEQVLA